MAGVYGVKETKEIITLGGKIGMAFKLAAADEKYDFSDLMYLGPVIESVMPAIEDASIALKELGELDSEDAAEIVAHSNSVLGDSTPEEVTKEAILAGLHIAKLVSLLKKK